MAVTIDPAEDSTGSIEFVTANVANPSPANGAKWFPRVKAGGVVLSMMAALAEARVLGRAAGAGSGAPTALTGAQIAGLFSGDIGTAALADSAVTLAKQASMAAARVLGRASGAGSGAPTELTGTQIAGLFSGDIPYGALDVAVQASLDAADAAIPAPASTDNAVARFDGTAGDVQNSSLTVDDNGNVAWIGALKPPAPATPAYAASLSLDIAEDNDFTVGTLTGNVTITFSNRAAGRSGVIRLTQDGTGGRTVTFNTESATVTFQKAYDSAGSQIPIAFPSTAAGVICDFHYRFVTATVCTIVPVRFGA